MPIDAATAGWIARNLPYASISDPSLAFAVEREQTIYQAQKQIQAYNIPRWQQELQAQKELTATYKEAYETTMAQLPDIVARMHGVIGEIEMTKAGLLSGAGAIQQEFAGIQQQIAGVQTKIGGMQDLIDSIRGGLEKLKSPLDIFGLGALGGLTQILPLAIIGVLGITLIGALKK